MVYLVSQKRFSDLFTQERLRNTNANVNVNVNVTLLKITLLDDETIIMYPYRKVVLAFAFVLAFVLRNLSTIQVALEY